MMDKAITMLAEAQVESFKRALLQNFTRWLSEKPSPVIFGRAYKRDSHVSLIEDYLAELAIENQRKGENVDKESNL